MTSGPDSRPAAEHHAFRRDLRPLDATMLVIGSMIGSGIFIVSADIARTVGSAGWILAVWALTGAMTLIAALCYGELAGMMPFAGGQYVYLREAYGPLTGFLYGWTSFMVIQSGTIAAVAMAFAKFTAVFLPALGARPFLIMGKLAVSPQQCVAITSIIVLTLINSRGIHTGKIVQDFFTLTKSAALIGLIVLGFAIGLGHDTFSLNTARFWEAGRAVVSGGAVSIAPLAGLALLAAIGTAMVGSLFSSDAWYDVTFASAEVVNPRRTIPLALIAGTAVVTLLYMAANIAYLMLLPLDGSPAGTDAVARGIMFAAEDRVGTAAASVIFGAPAVYIMAAMIMVSTFGCNNGLILSGARVYYAMARDGLFFKKAGTLNGSDVPGRALIVQAAWACLLCLTGTYSDLLDYVIFAVLVFFSLTVGGVLLLRRKNPDAERPFRAPGYPVTPIVYIVLATAIAADLLVYKPAYTWPGVIIVLLGIPVYFLWRRKTG
jgi:basic amino acid/polyamine antiporter, APA family